MGQDVQSKLLFFNSYETLYVYGLNVTDFHKEMRATGQISSDEI